MPQTTSNSTTQEVTPTPGVNSSQTRRQTKKSIAFSRLRRKLLRHVWVVRIGILISAILGFLIILFLSGKFFSNLGGGKLSEIVYSFVFTPSSSIDLLEGRTNMVLLGKGGENHTAGDLTDTIIFISISHDKGGVSLVSLPRDIWVPSIRAKLNSAYYWGNQKQPNGGLVLVKSEVEQIVGVPVHYGAVADFSTLIKIVDVLDGIEVNITRGFVDEKYPIAGRENDECGGLDPEFLCRYETIRFSEGKHVMDGETALKFVRSRNAEGDEGTDLAREARQQKVILAIKEKVLSTSTIFNPKRILAIWGVISDSFETDISPSEAAVLARKIFDSRNNVEPLVIPEDLLENPPISPRYDNQYVFVPENGDWEEIQKWIKDEL